ncbi:MAG: YedE-related selenium metabolism membrane protein, partial [Lachnospiraceae bacterium]
FHISFANQPIAHMEHLWNVLGMYAVGFAAVLAGGCPLRQLILAGQGSSDGAVTVLGLFAGAAMCHNFGLASSGEGTTPAGRIACVIAIAVCFLIGFVGNKRKA